MSDHSDALTPEIKEFVERGRQFQEWANENGFGVQLTCPDNYHSLLLWKARHHGNVTKECPDCGTLLGTNLGKG